jgi:hypothetical protein
MLLTRRKILALSTAGAFSALAGCTSVARIYRVIAPTLTLPPSPLRGWDDIVRRAWGSGKGRFSLSPIEVAGPSAPPDATWVAQATPGTSVAPLLQSVNLRPGSLAPWAVDAFTDATGSLTAFPVAVGQLQFYVNGDQLKLHGITDLTQWTWAALETAVAPVAGSHAAVVGWGWGLVKSLLETRPIYHHRDATIRGHVFVSFLALVLHDELQRRLAAKGLTLEWGQVRQDLAALQEVEVREGEQWYLLRTALQGVAGKVLQAVGVAVPPPVRPLPVVPTPDPALAVP